MFGLGTCPSALKCSLTVKDSPWSKAALARPEASRNSTFQISPSRVPMRADGPGPADGSGGGPAASGAAAASAGAGAGAGASSAGGRAVPHSPAAGSGAGISAPPGAGSPSPASAFSSSTRSPIRLRWKLRYRFVTSTLRPSETTLPPSIQTARRQRPRTVFSAWETNRMVFPRSRNSRILRKHLL